MAGILTLVAAGCAASVLAQGPTELNGAQWIWAGPSAGDNYPVGNATFRSNYSPPTGRVPVSSNISVSADNAYTLYVNGLQIGNGGDFHKSEGYMVRLDPERNVFAVEAQNQPITPDPTAPNPAGLLAAIRIRFSDSSTETIVTDGGWRAVMGTPAGFEQVAFDDSAWPAAFPQGAWPNTSPWNNGNGPQSPEFNQDMLNLTGRNGKTKVGAIVGGVVGGVVGFLIIAGLAVWLRRRKQQAISALEMQHHSVYKPFYPDLVDRSLARNAAFPSAEPVIITSLNSDRSHTYHPSSGNLSSAAGVAFSPPSSTSSNGSGPSQDLRSEMGQLRREVEALRTERILESEAPPLYALGGNDNAGGEENVAGQVSASVPLVPFREKS